MSEPSWLTDLDAAAAAFRLGKEGPAQEHMKAVIDGLMASAAQGALPAEVIRQLPEVLAAQQRADGLYLADLLQYEIAPRFRRR